MADSPQPLNLGSFWALLGKVALRLVKERAHAEISVIFDNGTIKIVRVNRTYLPGNLPEG